MLIDIGIEVSKWECVDVCIKSEGHHLTYKLPESELKFSLDFQFSLMDPNTQICFKGILTDNNANPVDVTGFQIVDSVYYPIIRGQEAWDPVTWSTVWHNLFGFIVWLFYNSEQIVKSNNFEISDSDRAGKCLLAHDNILRTRPPVKSSEKDIKPE